MARISALISLLLLVVLPAAAVGAERVAPEYTSSDPAAGEELHQAPETVTITFSEPLQEGDSTIEVTDHCGRRVDDRNVQVSLNEMSVGLAKTPSGHYMVTYVATGLAGVTGSTEGDFGFTVHAGKSCSGGGVHHGGHGGNTGGQSGEGHGRHGGADHDMDGHTEHQGAASSGTHSGHDAGTNSSGGHSGTHEDRHDGKGHQNHHAAQAAQDTNADSSPDLAAAQTPFPQLSPDSTAVILALLLCAGFGVLGGWVLRVSGPR